jgi:polyribonucleotide nucleotidyltransferase
MISPFNPIRLTAKLGQNEIIMETNRLANQADGAVWVQCGGTVVLVTACTQPLEMDKGFFPLVVDYKEMSYAAGRIPGGYFRREIGRPSEREVLVCRLIDRPCRPLFPKGFRDEVQIIVTVLSAEPDIDPDVLAITGASAALHISKIPFMGPLAGGRVGYVDGQFVINPSAQVAREQSSLNLVFAATREAVVMVEAGCKFVSEDLINDALEWGHKQIMPLLDMQEELRTKMGSPKIAVAEIIEDTALTARIEELANAELSAALTVPEKMARKDARKAVKVKTLEAVMAERPEEVGIKAKVSEYFESLEKKIMRARIATEGKRNDGRDTTTVRPLGIEIGVLPRTHGSALFARGETKALCVATLGSSGDEQRIETLLGETSKRWMLHYNFPPFCVGEVKMLRGPSRREIGHGTLAERALTPILPPAEDFPFTMRVVSEVMESNGSSSMATVCGASLALMDAGVPVTDAVAGVAMGLIEENGEYHILTDILGDEDKLGDMDFKVAGTATGVTALQMDIKITGIPSAVMRRALAQAREARLHILRIMNQMLDKPRPELSPYAPQLEIVMITPEKIREVIGPGGKNIKAITAATGAAIDIEDSGKVSIFAPSVEALEKAKEMVLFHDQKAEVGKNYKGQVVKIIDCGAVVQLQPGLDGLVHVSQLALERVENVSDVLTLGQELEVKVIEVEGSGRVRLSRKAVLMEEAGETVDLAQFAKTPSRRPGGGFRDRDGRGDRGRRRD